MTLNDEKQLKHHIWENFLKELGELMPNEPQGQILTAVDTCVVAVAKATDQLEFVPNSVKEAIL